MKLKNSATGALTAAFLSVLTSGVSVQAATVIGGSDLFTTAGLAQAESWLDSAPGLAYSGSLAFTNIFDSAGGSTSTNFHAAVDGMGPTIVLMRVTPDNSANPSTSPQIIGGFDPQSWNSSATFNFSATTADRTAFLFNLTTNTILYQQRAVDADNYQTFNAPTYGPAFGAGMDLAVNSTDLMTGYAFVVSYCINPANPCYPATNVLGGSNSVITFFTVSEIEAFTIAPDLSAATPLPAALPLFVSGLGALGLLGWRRKKKTVALAA